MKWTQLQSENKVARLAVAATLSAALLAAVAGAQAPIFEEAQGARNEVGGLADPRGEAFAAPKAVRLTPSERAGIDVSRVPEVRLERIDTDALLREDSEARTKKGGFRISVGRNVAVAPVDGNWFTAADGSKLWSAEIVATDALGLRLHFSDFALPAGAELAIYAPTASTPERGVVKSGFSRFDPERNVETYSGAAADQAKEFWSWTHFGDRVRIELSLPAGADAAALPFKVDSLQHVYRDPMAAEFETAPREKAAGPCHNDPNCFPEWENVARSVARITFVDGGSGFLCTGSLINNLKNDFTPYFLTAAHCISTASVASTLDVFWFYETNSCNGSVPSPASVPRSHGSTLVSTAPSSDGTLLLVDGALPGGLFWAGWTAGVVPTGNAGASIHHPSGDFKRISFETKGTAEACPNSNWTRIDWTNGPTEGGSSGSGVFRGDTKQLFGTLTGGPSSCGNESYDCYGTFASHYTRFRPALQAGGSDDNSEQNDSCAKARLVRAGTFTNRVVKVLDQDWYKISVPKGKTLRVRLNFANANGDIDLQFFGACGGEIVARSEGVGDSEEILVQNVSTRTLTGYWRVFLGDTDTRALYNMTVAITN